MKSIWKRVRRILIAVLILLIGAVILNSKTRFFKDIGKNIPFLEKLAPDFTYSVSYISDKTNELLSSIPKPAELWAHITNSDVPVDPADAAPNEPIQNDTMLSFYSNDCISVSVGGTTADIFGVAQRTDERYLVYRFADRDMNTLSEARGECDRSGQFRAVLTIPDGAYQLVMYAGAERAGEYESKLYNYIYLTQAADGSWSIAVPPTYEHNLSLFTKVRSRSAALKNTYDVCCDYGDIKALAETLTRGCETDYDKALKIHDWICENIYYDVAGVSATDISATAYVASDVLYQRRAVCLGYSNLYAALCRASGLPCTVVTGYALGVDGDETEWSERSINTNDANHAWNEVNLDGRWVIVDTTWDSHNKLKAGKWEQGRGISHLFFDANLRFFSQNHKITGYSG